MITASNTTGLNNKEISNVTTRRGRKLEQINMAQPYKLPLDLGRAGGSILIDSILSQDETRDVVSMMIMANEYGDVTHTPSFCTSTQMGGRNQQRRPKSPQLSPLSMPGIDGRCEHQDTDFRLLGGQRSVGDRISTYATPDKVLDLNRINSESVLCQINGNLTTDQSTGTLPTRAGGEVMKLGFADAVDDASFTTGTRDATEQRVAMASNQATACNQATEIGDDVNKDDTAVKGVEVEAGAKDGTELNNNEEDGKADKGDNDKTDKHDDAKVGDDKPLGDGVEARYAGEDGDEAKIPNPVASKLSMVEQILTRLDERSALLTDTVSGLVASLEFSQHEIDLLKKDNADLRKALGSVETEDKRTQFQVSGLEDKLDRLETSTKKKNLVLEGVPETEGRKEDSEKTVGTIFDQLLINQGINFDACYRVGSYISGRSRPILVSFERQGDRDLVYSKRFDLKQTRDYQRVWINEDMGAMSKRKRGIIRMISKEAQQLGVDCRTGKFAIHIDKKKFDGDNLDELPPPLHPSSLKQIQIDDHTLAYQSEYAPFSNFFPCNLVIGKHKFFCLEQAYQFLKAKTMNKPLTATKIFMSRDVRFIKQQGAEMGTSEEWEKKQFDVMYECLRKKFDQNQDLKALLLKTKDLELVEATPDRLWGCGATLSSNIIRKRNSWPGQNKHGQILMIIRQEYLNEI